MITFVNDFYDVNKICYDENMFKVKNKENKTKEIASFLHYYCNYFTALLNQSVLNKYCTLWVLTVRLLTWNVNGEPSPILRRPAISGLKLFCYTLSTFDWIRYGHISVMNKKIVENTVNCPHGLHCSRLSPARTNVIRSSLRPALNWTQQVLFPLGRDII